ncbi:aspartate carbamoyltransferase catalytic subunit [Iamia sp.]|uniref:aspartate carbamoyltransferase catalytic subunit n=1 Tax=Iamia sp. TaxID=2722710 RepID=UPI002C27A22D|nr:aspartate carbamoyltransferase catalytic subunit [Iamia sp.]HXH57873.1 aspartate carbamoyltransferase catalytic subunit [Iamia sp.]
MKHLLDTASLSRDDVEELLELTDAFVEVSERSIPKVPALRGRTVASLFFEDSTRTRLSFETAAKRLSADTMTFSVSSSSVNKGESLRDTALTIEAMGVDAVVVRHRSAGAPHRVASWIDASVINGGDGWHDHPTQGLLDAYTLRSRLGPLDGRRVALVGDIKHSRVARADIHAFTILGAEVTLVAPPTLLPPSIEGWPVTVAHHLDEVLPDVDAVYLLRMQRERMTESLVPTLREYTSRYGLTVDRARRLGPEVVIMHPGPMNRGVEIAPEVADDPRAVIVDQVRNGVAVRMAVLFRLLGAEGRPTGRRAAVGAADPASPKDTDPPNPSAMEEEVTSA